MHLKENQKKLNENESEEELSPKEAALIYIKTFLVYLIIPVLIVALLTSYVVLVVNVPTSSMERTIMAGDFAVANRLAYIGNAEPQRGDIIIFTSEEVGKNLLKRVIATAGETVEFRDGDVYIDGELLNEDYTATAHSTFPATAESYTVPEGCVFVMGDNREHSIDARYWDNPYTDIDTVLGRVIMLK